MRAENVTGIANKVAKRDERAQELSHKAATKTNAMPVKVLNTDLSKVG